MNIKYSLVDTYKKGLMAYYLAEQFNYKYTAHAYINHIIRGVLFI